MQFLEKNHAHIVLMSFGKRKRLSAVQKAQVVLEAIREDRSVAEIATENSVHPNQIHKWKRQALEDFAQLFEDDHIRAILPRNTRFTRTCYET